MLAGRESLVRLVGKRKRTLSSSVLSFLLLQESPSPPPPPPPPPPHLPDGVADVDAPDNSLLAGPTATTSALELGASTSRQGGEVDGEKKCDSNWVDCPVCGSTINSADYAVNLHLDSCLARGTKRRLTQRTLVQLNFFSKSSNQLSSYDLCKEDKYIKERETDVNNGGENLNSAVSELGSEQNCVINEYFPKSLLHPQLSQEICNPVLADTASVKLDDAEIVDDIESITSSCCFSDNADKLPNFAAGHTGNMLETFIVGRRFHDSVDLWPCAGISILREPENAKDHHAIKVICTVSGCEKMLGYLPRELAKYLSPLIEMYDLKFEGFVTSLPKHPFDAVPICLICEQMAPYLLMEPSNSQVFESLWKNAVHVVEYSKKFPGKKMRYQQNFHIMIQEVMNQHAHLFMDNEKSFIGSFGSLSDDSQRLFICLLTRKV